MNVLVPIRTGNGLNDRRHWAARAKRVKREREATALCMRAQRPGVNEARLWVILWTTPVLATLTRVAPSAGLDGDNLQGALKGVRDQVAAELGVDDGDERVTWRYAQERGPWGVRVEVTT